MTTITRPATERQVAYVNALVQRIYGADNAPEALLALRESGALDSTTSASAAIDRLRARASAAPAPVARTSAPTRTTVATGFYALDGRVYRVVPARHGSHNYAKVLVPSGTSGRGRWEYAPGALRLLAGVAPLTREEAASYGQSHGYCIVCGALLTDPESIARGIGPVCANRF